MDDRTTDLGFAAFLLAHGWLLKRIEGSPRRYFVFDREIPSNLLMTFQGSAEKKALDSLRSLKVLVMQHTG